MGLQDRDYMRDTPRVTRATHQRRPGDPRSAAEVFLPGTVHARPRRRVGPVAIGIIAFVIASAVMLLLM